MPACCVRSASTAPRPISTPTCRRITTSISSTITSWSIFPTRILRSRRCLTCLTATRSRASTWSCACARSAEFFPNANAVMPGLDPGIHVFGLRFTDVDGRDERGRDYRLRRGRGDSIHLFVGVDAPQALLLDPAVKAVAGDMAPVLVAFPDLRNHASLQTRGHRTAAVCAIMQRRELLLALHSDDGGAAAGQERVIDPPLGAFAIAYAPP